MTIGGTFLAHGEKWAATVDDERTVRIIRDELTKAIQEHERIAASITDKETRAAFNQVFENNVRRCQAVIATCNKRLQAWKDLTA